MREAIPTISAPHPYWDGSRIYFDVVDDNQCIPCAISAMALEELCGRRCYKPAEALARFAAERARIERLAVAKYRTRPAGVSGRLSLWADDIDDLPDGGMPKAATGSLMAAARA